MRDSIESFREMRRYYVLLKQENSKARCYIHKEVEDIVFYAARKSLVKIRGVWERRDWIGDGIICVPYPVSIGNFLHINMADYYEWAE